MNFDYEYVGSDYISTDFFHLNNNSTKTIFLLNGEKSRLLEGIGLLIPSKSQFRFNQFFETLKKYKIINSTTWTLKYFNNGSLRNYIDKKIPISEFMFGEEPHAFEENRILYNESNYHSVLHMQHYNFLYWHYIFYSIYHKNDDNITIIAEKKHIEINPEISYII